MNADDVLYHDGYTAVGGSHPSLATVRRLVNAAGFDLRLELVPRAIHQDALIAVYKTGVDRTLLRENLRKTVDRRLRDMEAFRQDAEQLRVAVRGTRRGKRTTSVGWCGRSRT